MTGFWVKKRRFAIKSSGFAGWDEGCAVKPGGRAESGKPEGARRGGMAGRLRRVVLRARLPGGMGPGGMGAKRAFVAGFLDVPVPTAEDVDHRMARQNERATIADEGWQPYAKLRWIFTILGALCIGGPFSDSRVTRFHRTSEGQRDSGGLQRMTSATGDNFYG